MQVGIVGLPTSGKTTVFSALVGHAAQPGARARPSVGVVKVPDPRLDALAELFGSRQVVQAEVAFVDLPPAPEGFGETCGIGGQFLNDLQAVDALMVVSRAFDDPSVPHPTGSVDPVRDAEAMLYELVFSDIEIIDRRIARLQSGLKGAKAAERAEINGGLDLMARLKAGLETGVAVGSQRLSEAEAPAIAGYRFLTAKPCIVAANSSEDAAADDLAALERGLRDGLDWPNLRALALRGKLEMELAQMEPEDEIEFRAMMDAPEPTLQAVIELAYEALDLVTFFTGNQRELRAWPVVGGTPASRAAGKIHSDFEAGFIRAEVVGFHDFTRCGGYAESRRQGLLRQQGRDYGVRDGDVIHFLSNV